MYPSNSNGCCSDPMAHTDSSFLLHVHFAADPSLSFFNFPSPCYNQCEFEVVQDHGVFLQQDHDLLLHNQTLMAADSVSVDTIVNVPGSRKSHDATEVARKTPGKRTSSSKRDRHNKINTANGPRDRRMRLLRGSSSACKTCWGTTKLVGPSNGC
ncbi:hypothetical protein HRI_003961800 [Hibiscus trionum]|uniref:TCP domain-containing protein n=1 Tax=Hibiscus trionum TaxID=183268 RepID=A0A9W7IWA2_HIBTR|nr:hypothetical protein HRI_003961800 [Hibiscus trionum]